MGGDVISQVKLEPQRALRAVVGLLVVFALGVFGGTRLDTPSVVDKTVQALSEGSICLVDEPADVTDPLFGSPEGALDSSAGQLCARLAVEPGREPLRLGDRVRALVTTIDPAGDFAGTTIVVDYEVVR